MTTVVEGVDGTVATVVRRLDEEREATQAMTTQMTMGMITKTTKLAIDTPTPIEMALEIALVGVSVGGEVKVLEIRTLLQYMATSSE